MKKYRITNIGLIISLITSLCLMSCNNGQKFDKLIPFQEEEDGNWGYINFNGKKVIENNFYKQPSLFYDGLAIIENKNGTFDYIDKKGTDMGYGFLSVTFFDKGVACVVEKDQNPKIIDRSMKVIATLDSVEKINCFSEGLACFQDKKGKWGYIDSKGKTVIKAQYDNANSFSDGLAMVEKNIKEVQDTSKKNKDKNEVIVDFSKKDKLCKGFIDKSGKEIISLSDRFYYLYSFSEGLAAYSDGDEYGWGYINKKGEKAIRSNPEWSQVTDFVNGYASIKVNGNWGLIDKDGKIIIHPKYDTPLHFSNGLASVEIKNEIGFINSNDEMVIEPGFKDVVMPFISKVSIVKNKNGFYDIINKKGKRINKMDLYNVEFSSAPYYWVQSNFFDITQLLDSVFKGLTAKSIEGVSSESNVSDIMKIYNLPESDLPSDSWIKELTLPSIEKEDIRIVKTISFSANVADPIQKRNYYGWYYYDETVGYKPNPKALAESVSTKIYLSGKASGKGDKVIQGMKKLLTSDNFIISEENKQGKKIILKSGTDELKIEISYSDDEVDMMISFTKK